MWDHQQLRGGIGIEFGVEGASVGRAFELEPRPAIDKQVEIELARAPTSSAASSEVALETFQRREQREGARRGIGDGRHGQVQRDHRIAEFGLVGHAHGIRGIQAGNAADPGALELAEGAHRGGKRRPRVADVCPQADIRADSMPGHGSPVVRRIDSIVMTPRPVSVRILHPEPGPASGPIERWVADARDSLAARHGLGFAEAVASDVAIRPGPPVDTPFGARLRSIVETERPAGLVILGSGAVPLAIGRDYRDLVAAASSEDCIALANNRFSSDVVAIAAVEMLPAIPDLPGDNALPRWLAEIAGYRVRDLSARWRLAMDVDGPLDLLLLGHPGGPPGVEPGIVRERLAAARSIASNRRAEVVVTGRVSARTLVWLERRVPARIRAIIEERGLRAASRLAQAEATPPRPAPRGPARPPRSLLGGRLERTGPGDLGRVLAELGDAAFVDTRVLLAHRLGPDEAAWPGPEDRFASDLLLAERVRDPWLRELTEGARDATIPVLLGGHSLVGPGIRLLLGTSRSRATAARLSWS